MTFSKTEVNLDICIINLMGISENDASMSIMFEMTASWHDPRLKFNFLKGNTENRLSGERNETRLSLSSVYLH